MVNFILFLIVISILIFVHECGHFFAAKLFKVKVETFALGFGPTLFSKKGRETTYKINLFPLGGYVKLFGETAEESTKDDKNSFDNQEWYKKFIIIISGVIMNFLLACIIYTLILVKSSFIQYLPYIPGIPLNLPFGKVTDVTAFQINIADKESPIYSSNLKGSYVFTKINDKYVYSTEEVTNIITLNKGKKIKFVINDMQTNEEKTLELTPRENPEAGKGALGVILLPSAKVQFDGFERPIGGILYSADMFKYNASSLYNLIEIAIKSKQSKIVTDSVTGPIGIYEITGEVYQMYGFIGILSIIAILSLALAFMNILPFPVLDGGAAFIVLLEVILRKKINLNVKNIINNIGAIILIALTLFIMYNDIKNFQVISQIQHWFGK